jgi:hypothetical protein
MPRIKVFSKKNRAGTHKIKIYGISIEAILIASFILIVLFVIAVWLVPASEKEKKIIRPGIATDDYRPVYKSGEKYPHYLSY